MSARGQKVASTGKSPFEPDFKFTQATDEYKMLKKMVEGGEVTAATRPQDIEAMKEEFAKIKADKFRAQFDKLKNIYGIGTREVFQKEKVMLDTLREGGEKILKAKMEDVSEDESEAGAAPVKERCNWIPQCLQGTCEATVGIQHAALIIALTGGGASSDTSKIEVTSTNDGYSILVSEEWCEEMVDMDLFYKNVEKRDDKTDGDLYMRRFAMIKSLRDKQLSFNFGPVRSIFHSSLPFQADPSTLKHEIFGNEEGSRFLHIDLTEKKRIKVDKIKMMAKGNHVTPKKA